MTPYNTGLHTFTRWIFVLILIEVVFCAPGWLEAPDSNVFALPGTDVTLKWNYDLDGVQLERIAWGILSDNNMVQTMASQVPNQPINIVAGYVGKVEVVSPGTLIIKNVSSSDTNDYGCVVETDTTVSLFSSAALTVLVNLPIFQTEPPTYKTINEGDGPTDLEAIIVSDRGIQLSWSKDTVGASSRYTTTTQVIGVTSDGKSIFKIVLTIPKAQVRDLGNYTLIGGFGSYIAFAVTASTFLNVQYSPRNMMFTMSPYPMKVPIGETVNITCNVESNPLSEISISKGTDGTLNEPGKRTIMIPDVNEDNEGQYICVANNNIGSSASAALELYIVESDSNVWLYYLIGGLIVLILIIVIISFLSWRKRSVRKRVISQRKNEVVGRANETKESRRASLENLERVGVTNGGMNGFHETRR